MTARLAPTGPWADLPPELLSAVSSHLHDATDFVRFHAVCKPWRHSAASSQATAFLPWLLAPCKGQILHSVVRFSEPRIPNSEAATADDYTYTYNDVVLAVPPPRGPARTRDDVNCVARADGTAAWRFTPRPKPRLHHLLAVTRLPRLPDDGRGAARQLMEDPHAIVYGDGTVLLYRFVSYQLGPPIWKPAFMAAVLHPGDASWTVVEMRLDVWPHGRPVAACHDGRVLLLEYVQCQHWVSRSRRRGRAATMLGAPRDAGLERECGCEECHALESRGELMWAPVMAERGWRTRYAGDTLPPSALHVTVHALLEAGPEDGGGGKMRWVARDGRSLGDRVLFLGCPASFALDAAPPGVPGGCAYFVFVRGVYRYNLVDGEAKIVQWVRPRWGGAAATCVWLRPQPAIAPIEEIRERLAGGSKQEQGSGH